MTQELLNTIEEVKASVRGLAAEVEKVVAQQAEDAELLEMIRDYYKRKAAKEKEAAYEELNCYIEVMKGWGEEK